MPTEEHLYHSIALALYIKKKKESLTNYGVWKITT